MSKHRSKNKNHSKSHSKASRRSHCNQEARVSSATPSPLSGSGPSASASASSSSSAMAHCISLPPLFTPSHSPPSSSSPSSSSSTPAPLAKRGLLYFIPGNPGYIEYYRDFLLALRSVIDSSEAQYHDRRAPTLHIYGRDLAGFQDDDHHRPFGSRNPPVDVQGQVDTIRRVLERFCSEGLDGDQQQAGAKKGFDFIVLMAHSVGAYFSLCLAHRHASPALPIRHAILLFPTICHIALSPRGRLATPLLNAVPPTLAARVARAAVWPWPRGALRWTLARVLGMEDRAAAVTEQFLKSRDGVLEALWLTRDEMRVIKEERWGEAFWQWGEGGDDDGGETRSAATSVSRADGREGTKIKAPLKTPRFFMFFGGTDGWVDNAIRDEFVARTKGLGGVKAVIDSHGLPHAFCVNEFHSVVVAALIKDWIRDIQEGFVDDRPVDEASGSGSGSTVGVDETVKPNTKRPMTGRKSASGEGAKAGDGQVKGAGTFLPPFLL